MIDWLKIRCLICCSCSEVPNSNITRIKFFIMGKDFFICILVWWKLFSFITWKMESMPEKISRKGKRACLFIRELRVLKIKCHNWNSWKDFIIHFTYLRLYYSRKKTFWPTFKQNCPAITENSLSLLIIKLLTQSCGKPNLYKLFQFNNIHSAVRIINHINHVKIWICLLEFLFSLVYCMATLP